MKKFLSVAALFSSFTTIFCCFLPALFVTLGAGASFATLISAVPQLIWFSEHKGIVFLGGAFLLLISGFFQWRARYASCPIDPKLAEGCTTARNWSRGIFLLAVSFYSLGALFAFVIPYVVEKFHLF